MHPSLQSIFQELNHQHFEGVLPMPSIRWNGRLISCAGRFLPASRSLLRVRQPIIELSMRILEVPDSVDAMKCVLGHEMIHYWLWFNGRPFGHTTEFHRMMKKMGVPRYSPLPKRDPKYLYVCPECSLEYPKQRKMTGSRACGVCCDKKNGGRFDRRFLLKEVKRVVPILFFLMTTIAMSGDDQHVWVSRVDKSITCSKGSGQTLEDDARMLNQKKIRVFGQRKNQPNDQALADVCGIPTGRENSYEIDKKDLKKVEKLGFKVTKP